MEGFFKNYGSAIGPALAFLLGILALYIHNTISAHLEREKTVTKFQQLKQMINDSPPPSKYFPRKSESDFMHADQARNLTNVSIFYNRLLASKVLINNLENKVYTDLDVTEIRQFNNIKWWHDILVKNVEEIRNGDIRDYDINKFNQLRDAYDDMNKAARHPEKLFQYSE